MTSGRPAVARYDCFRKFLADYVAHRQSLHPAFSYRRLSQLSGIRNPSFLRQVVQGKRNMSVQLARQVGEALRLSEGELNCFCALVSLSVAGSCEERALAEEVLERSRCELVTRRLRAEEVRAVVARWHHLAVRELALLPDFSPDGSWISARLRNLVTPEEADASLVLLIRTGFLVQEAETGRYLPSEPALDTGDETAGDALMAAHLDTLRMWERALPRTASAHRELGLLNIPLPARLLPELKKRMRRFESELIGWLQSADDPDALVQLGLYLVPLTEIRESCQESVSNPGSCGD